MNAAREADRSFIIKLSGTTVLFILIQVGLDFYYGKGSLLWPGLTAVSGSAGVFIFRENAKKIRMGFYVWLIVLLLYISLLVHATFMDPFGVFLFGLLFTYAGLIFRGWKLLVFYALSMCCVMFILHLYRAKVLAFTLSQEEVAGYLRLKDIISYLFLIINGMYIYGYFKQRSHRSEQAEPAGQSVSGKLFYSYQSLKEAAFRRDNSFINLFNGVHPDFTQNLLNLNHGLTEAEIEICALIKLHFTTKEIAEATNSSYKAIEAKKYRIRKKLNLGSEVNLAVYFNSGFFRSEGTF